VHGTRGGLNLVDAEVVPCPRGWHSAGVTDRQDIPELRQAMIALTREVLDRLSEETPAGPEIEPDSGRVRWVRRGGVWLEAVPIPRWHSPFRPVADPTVGTGALDTFETMASVRCVMLEHDLLARWVDRYVGTAFHLSHSKLDIMLVRQLLAPQVVRLASYTWDEQVFDEIYLPLEQRLLAHEVVHVEALPVIGLQPYQDVLRGGEGVPEVAPIDLGDHLGLRLMTDEQLGFAVEQLAVPTTNRIAASVEVPEAAQWALVTEHTCDLISSAQLPDQNLPAAAPPYPSLHHESDNLVAAIRVVCGGSVTTTSILIFNVRSGQRIAWRSGQAAQVDLTRPGILTANKLTRFDQSRTRSGRCHTHSRPACVAWSTPATDSYPKIGSSIS
jgi:hypothetical protein